MWWERHCGNFKRPERRQSRHASSRTRYLHGGSLSLQGGGLTANPGPRENEAANRCRP